MGGGGGGAPHEVPDWRSYKAEGIPELDHLQKRLGALGLRDPWIRNEVWRFQHKPGHKSWVTRGFRITFRGFGLALAAMAVTILYDKTVNKNSSDDGHGHH